MRKLWAAFLAICLLVSLLAGCAEQLPEGPSLNGVSLSQYAIVYDREEPDYTLRAAEYIRDQIQDRTGLALTLLEDDEAPTDHEIVVGQTCREISGSLETPAQQDTFAITADKNHVALEGRYFLIAAAAYYFVQTYITGNDFHATFPAETTLCHPITQEATGYIFLIGDGMGFAHTQLYEAPPMQLKRSDGYSDGETLFYGYLLPAQGKAHTGSLTGVTDSAAAATALATGYKTYNAQIGLDGDGQPVESLTELANRLGMSTAVMSTEVRTGATPSGFLAHVTDRTEKEAILESQAVIEAAGTIINCDHDVYETGKLQELEETVLSVIDTLSQDAEGFFLMYEEAHIDKHSHDNDLNNTFLTVVRFNRIIGAVMEYAYYHPNIFVLITADHETGDLQVATKEFLSDTHTGQDVPIFAHGHGSESFDGQVMENTQIPKNIAQLWGVEDFGSDA